MKFEVRKNLFGKHQVFYRCPHCQGELNSPLADAGKTDKCPLCEQYFKCPGDEWVAAEQRAKAQKAAEEKEAAERKQKEALDYAAPATPEPLPPKEPLPPSAFRPPRDGPFIVCPNPNCDYRGPAHVERDGDGCAGVLLLFLFVLPGILYLIFKMGSQVLCPRCGVHVRRAE